MKTALPATRSSNVTVTPQAFVRVVEEAMEFFGIAIPGDGPGKPLRRTSDRMDRDGNLLPLLQGEFTRQFQGAPFVHGLDFQALHGISSLRLSGLDCTR